MPPLGPRTQTKATRQAQAKAYVKRQQAVAKLPKPKPVSDVKHALKVGESVHRRYEQSTQNPLIPKNKIAARPFPYSSERQVQKVNYESLADDVLKHLAARYGGKTSKAKVVRTGPNEDAYSVQGRKGVYVSPDTAIAAFSGNKQARDRALTTPVHEYAHTRQRPSIASTRLVEGGADDFMRAIAPGFYKALGISVKAGPSNQQYKAYARSVKRRGGSKYVVRKQFR